MQRALVPASHGLNYHQQAIGNQLFYCSSNASKTTPMNGVPILNPDPLYPDQTRFLQLYKIAHGFKKHIDSQGVIFLQDSPSAVVNYTSCNAEQLIYLQLVFGMNSYLLPQGVYLNLHYIERGGATTLNMASVRRSSGYNVNNFQLSPILGTGLCDSNPQEHVADFVKFVSEYQDPQILNGRTFHQVKYEENKQNFPACLYPFYSIEGLEQYYTGQDILNRQGTAIHESQLAREFYEKRCLAEQQGIAFSAVATGRSAALQEARRVDNQAMPLHPPIWVPRSHNPYSQALDKVRTDVQQLLADRQSRSTNMILSEATLRTARSELSNEVYELSWGQGLVILAIGFTTAMFVAAFSAVAFAALGGAIGLAIGGTGGAAALPLFGVVISTLFTSGFVAAGGVHLCSTIGLVGGALLGAFGMGSLTAMGVAVGLRYSGLFVQRDRREGIAVLKDADRVLAGGSPQYDQALLDSLSSPDAHVSSAPEPLKSDVSYR